MELVAERLPLGDLGGGHECAQSELEHLRALEPDSRGKVDPSVDLDEGPLHAPALGVHDPQSCAGLAVFPRSVRVRKPHEAAAYSHPAGTPASPPRKEECDAGAQTTYVHGSLPERAVPHRPSLPAGIEATHAAFKIVAHRRLGIRGIRAQRRRRLVQEHQAGLREVIDDPFLEQPQRGVVQIRRRRVRQECRPYAEQELFERDGSRPRPVRGPTSYREPACSCGPPVA